MNREQRRPWVALTESGYVLCAFCQYRQWLEDDCCCQHPLEAVREPRTSNIMEPSDDCWGFRRVRGDTVEAAAVRVQEWRAEAAEREPRMVDCCGLGYLPATIEDAVMEAGK